MKYRLFATALVFSLANLAIAQNEVDALRYSFHETPMTARSLGTGGAFGALGADLSSFFHNPAGLGVYKRGGIEMSLGLSDQFTNSTYMNQGANNGRTHVNLNNIGLVGSQQGEKGDWKSFNFGVAYAKTNNFYENFSIKGKSESSLLIPFSIQANGVSPVELYDYFPFTAGIAADAGLIIPTDSTGNYYYPASAGELTQYKNVTRTGSMGETAFGFGANYRDFFYFGMTVNFQSVRFIEKSSHTETFGDDQPVKEFVYNEQLRSDGSGVNAKFGVIVKPSEWLRVGAAFHTPSRITLHETYFTSITDNPANGSTDTYNSPDLITDYSVRTPSVTLANAAFILGKVGVITADYEYTNYDRIRMRGSSTNDYDYKSENTVISTIYRSTHKVRVGVEMRVLSTYYMRAGAIYQQNPLVNNVGAINNPFITYTGGIGFRNDHICVDLGLGYTTKESTYYMYDPRFVQATSLSTKLINGLLSFGYRF